ncbi:MAG TPA: hypothetical protein DCQ98_11000 [Planctomycetaceae bacterium]|nr:hypothetical protein [Planctomycetaceae bacterium]HRE99015.1 hypothetical protein [Pirellulaceae bacterium]
MIGGIAGLLSLLTLMNVMLLPLSLTAMVLGPLGLLMIRRHPDEYTGARWGWIGAILGPLTLFGGFVSDSVRLRLEVPEGYELVDWYDLEPDAANQHKIVSDRAADLVGKKIYLRGYVYPGTSKMNLRQFIMVRDSGTCCFGGQPKATDMVIVNFTNDLRVNYSLWSRGLGGTFQVKPPGRQLAGVQLGAYYLDADVLK